MSETIEEQTDRKIPWVFGPLGIRIPKVKFPSLEDKNLDIPTPSQNILLGLIYIFLFWLMMGGVYLAIPDSSGNTPISLGADSNGSPVWLYPGISDAFVIESIVAAAIIFIGAVGFLILYQATKHMYNTSYAHKLIVAGAIMALFSFVALQLIIDTKVNPNS